MITLRQLRYLSALARHRHFGRAAEDCAISQPALSMQVRELETLSAGSEGCLALQIAVMQRFNKAFCEEAN